MSTFRKTSSAKNLLENTVKSNTQKHNLHLDMPYPDSDGGGGGGPSSSDNPHSSNSAKQLSTQSSTSNVRKPSKSSSIRDKWQKTFKSVQKIGFRKVDEDKAAPRGHHEALEEEREDFLDGGSIKDGGSGTASPKRKISLAQPNYRGHTIFPLHQERLCAVCQEMVAVPERPKTKGYKCDLCKISYHAVCQEDLRDCAKNAEHARSRFAKTGRDYSISSDRSDEASPLPHLNAPKDILDKAKSEQVDPVYYLLKQATTIRTGRSSTAASPPPPSNVPNIVTDSTGCSDTDLNSSHYSTSAYSSVSQLAPNSYLSSQEHLSLSRYSAPALSSLKSPSMDSQNSDYGSDSQQRQLPPPSGGSPTNKRRGLLHRNVRKHSSIDTDDTSNASGSPCLSNSGSVNFLPHGQFAVVREYSAAGPEELSVRLGERVNVLESSDPNWWQVRRDANAKANKPDGRVGLVPAACLARIQPHERLIRVNQNLQLCAGNTSLRLLKDQIIFGHKEDTETDTRVRTVDDYRAKCPARYLIFLE